MIDGQDYTYVWCVLFIFSVSISYAANGDPRIREKSGSKNQAACKISEKLIPEKLLKIKPVEFKLQKSLASQSRVLKHQRQQVLLNLDHTIYKGGCSAFLRSDHKKDQKPSQVQS